MKRDLQISSLVLDMMIGHAEREYPNEACGIVLGPKGKEIAFGVFPIRNIQDELHAADPARYPRSATTAYQMDPKEVRIVEREAEVAATYPLKRLGDTDDVAGTVAFLCSPDAAWITGQTIVIDGGLTLTGAVQ